MKTCRLIRWGNYFGFSRLRRMIFALFPLWPLSYNHLIKISYIQRIFKGFIERVFCPILKIHLVLQKGFLNKTLLSA
jgi:hypothetical protein